MQILSKRTLATIVTVLSLTAALVAPASAQGQADETSGPTATFSGGGWGHGVGMSQYGSLGRAEAGHTYREILGTYYAGTTVADSNFGGNIKVLLTTSSTPAFIPDGLVNVTMGTKVIGTASAGQRITVLRDAATGGFGVRIADQEVCAPIDCLGGGVNIVSANGNLVPVKVEQTGHKYRYGQLRLVPTAAAGTSLYVMATRMTLDEYLLGLGEVPQSWPMEALKTQAVAGRTYALRQLQDRRARSSWTRPYDIDSTDGDQVYNGMTQETGSSGSRWVQAVNDTSREVSLRNGQPILAFYSSSNGGHSADSDYVFVQNLSYLRGVPDPFDDHASNIFGSWEREYDLDTLSRWLRMRDDTNVGTVTNIAINGNFGVGGRVDRATVTITGTSGTKTVTGRILRYRINAGASADGLSVRDGQLPGTNFTFDGIQNINTNTSAPIGQFKFRSIDEAAGTAFVRGWVLDPDSSESLMVRIFRNDEQIAAVTANKNRPKLDGKYGVGNAHGVGGTIDLVPGTNRICIQANDTTTGASKTISCRTTILGGDTTTGQRPIGDVETVTLNGTLITYAGWALDQDTANPIDIAVNVNGSRAFIIDANTSRPDIGATYGLGDNHGFMFNLDAGPGTYKVCVIARNDGDGKNTQLGCQTHTV